MSLNSYYTKNCLMQCMSTILRLQISSYLLWTKRKALLILLIMGLTVDGLI